MIANLESIFLLYRLTGRALSSFFRFIVVTVHALFVLFRVATKTIPATPRTTTLNYFYGYNYSQAFYFTHHSIQPLD
jgi:hypothetical protein